MPDYFYRFRSTNSLLDRFDELARQEIYFARPSELNDPMEGFRNLFWQGDDIVWRNLLKHYLFCLLKSFSIFVVTGSEFTISACDQIVYQTPEDLPIDPIRGIYQKICDVFLSHEILKDLISHLAAHTTPVRRDELSYYLRSLNPLAVSLVKKEMNFEKSVDVQTETTSSAEDDVIKNGLDNLGKLLSLTNSERVHEKIFAMSELIALQNDLILDFENIRTAEQEGWIFLVRDFPTYYIESLERLVYPDWHAACFVSDPTNPSMWGSYGDGHRGVCLKFSASTNSDGFSALDLYRIKSWSGSKNGVIENYAYVPHRFEEVRYDPEYPEINFFSSLGRVSMIKLNHFWYAGHGEIRSKSSDQIFKNENEWRQHYWETFLIGSISKTREWAHEKEFRLILTSNLQQFDDIPSRKLKYKFSDLAGIIFGMKTAKDDRLKIMKTIKEKCLSEGRSNFEFLQARYSVQDKKVELVPLNLLKIHTDPKRQ
jgi:hypothetical protein